MRNKYKADYEIKIEMNTIFTTVHTHMKVRLKTMVRNDDDSNATRTSKMMKELTML